MVSFFLRDYKTIISGVTLSELLLIIVSFSLVVKNKMIFFDRTKRLFFIIILGAILFSILSGVLFQFDNSMVSEFEVLSRCIRYFAYIFFVIICSDNLEKTWTLRIFCILTLMMAIYMILQGVLYYGWNVVLPVKIIPGIEWGREYNVLELKKIFDASYFRAYGIMAEPGYTAVMLMPVFAWYLMNEKLKRRIPCLLVLGLAAMLTVSMQIIVVLFATILYYVIGEFLRKREHVNVVTLVIVSGVLIVFFLAAILGFLAPIITRLSMIGEVRVNGGGGSTAVRLFRGFSVYSQLPWEAKLFGVGLGNIGNAVKSFDIETIYDSYANSELAVEFVNGISEIMIMSGFIGLLEFIVLSVNLFRSSNVYAKTIVIQWILFLFAGVGFYSLDTVLMISLIYIFNSEDIFVVGDIL